MMALFDTHALRWWLDDPAKLSTAAREFLTASSNSLVISAVIPWELAIKTRTGKMDVEPPLSRWQEMLGV